MILFPKSKINIGLHILGKREDGYHDIETIMVPTDWSDILEIVPSKSARHSLTTTGREVHCAPEKNLVFKAVNAMSEVCEIPPTDFYLHKIVPDGAGLGGGSADAASTVMGLNRLYNLGLSQSLMSDILSRVGADCPFFLYNHPMLATGTGTELSEIDIDLSGLCVVIVKPLSESVSTAQAYNCCHTDNTRRPLSELVINTDINAWQDVIVNDFEPGVSCLLPMVKSVKDMLMDRGAMYTSMSGSGSAVYGLFDRWVDRDDLFSAFDSCNCEVYIGKL